jgi:hypothetical protein
MKTSTALTVGKVYTRVELAEQFQITDATLNTGIFRPSGHDSIWLFVTEEKGPDLTQYRDYLDGDDLSWDGQTSGRKDEAVINHEAEGVELLLFYRKSKKEFGNYAFRYEGPFRYVSHQGSKPAHFLLRRVSVPGVGPAVLRTVTDDEEGVDEAVVEALERSQARGQGFLLDSGLRKALEDQAMNAAKQHFGALGYRWEDHSKTRPYDLRCSRGQELLYVEVKGTQTDGSEIILTPGEVTFARSHRGQMALFVQHSIRVAKGDDGFALGEGERHLILPWDVDLGTLKPVSFKYGLPASGLD